MNVDPDDLFKMQLLVLSACFGMCVTYVVVLLGVFTGPYFLYVYLKYSKLMYGVNLTL